MARRPWRRSHRPWIKPPVTQRFGDMHAGDFFDAFVVVPVSPYLFRQTSTAYTVAKDAAHETVIPARTKVLLIFQSAMFDPYAYENMAMVPRITGHETGHHVINTL